MADGITRRTFLKAGAAGVLAANLGIGSCSCASGGSCCPDTTNRTPLQAGIPLGGIGAGTVEIRDDGLFHDWQVMGNWRPDEMHLSVEDAFFAFYARAENDIPLARVLATQSRGGLVPVESIDYTGRFPFTDLAYCMPDSPCDVRLTAFSSFIPHNSADSGLPAAIFEFEVSNTSRKTCEIGLAACLNNFVGHGQLGARPVSKATSGSGWRGIDMRAENVPDVSNANGSMLLACLSNDARVHAGGATADVTRPFASSGRLDECPAAKGTPSRPITGAVSRSLELRPSEKATITFALTWHFPHFIDAEHIDIGRAYSNRFRSAAEVLNYVVADYGRLSLETESFRDVCYRSSLPHWLIDAVNAQFTTLFKSSWWTQDGTFAIWEGLGCCGTQTADVAYYGSFGLLALFPDLAKQAMRLSARFQNPSGRIPHFFPGTFQYPDAYHMIDLMPKFTLMAWRDYLWTGDRAYLDEMWPHVIKAMEHNRALDRNGDFLPDDVGIDQTYDGWEFDGASIYVGLINTVACRAVAEMARVQGETEIADQYERLAIIGAAALEKLLWNGEYYDLFYDIATDKRDKCCMADQMNGAWYARMLELGQVLPEDRVRSALGAVFAHNRGHDYIRNGVWLEGGPQGGGQWSAVWSGTEYMLASHMIYEGMIEQGITTAKQVYDRHAKDGRTWNHSECGDHYYRAMSVLTILYAAQGFHYSAPEKRLMIDPNLQRDNHVSPLVTPVAWGEVRYVQSSRGVTLSIEVMEGELPLQTIETGGEFSAAEVEFAGRKAAAAVEQSGGKCRALLPEAVSVTAGEVLMARIK